MEHIQIKSNPEVEKVFDTYPENVREKMDHLRKLVLETAAKTETITQLEETLKWGEPSYITKQGSTLRMDWKPKAPDQYALYFQCTSKLVPTFKMLYKDTFNFQGSRAIVFGLEDKLPEKALKDCIKATLTYHKVKHLPTLGM